MPLGIGLIGLGRHGMRYARHLLEPCSTGRLVAVCRRDVAQGQAFADEHGLRFFQDYRDLLADKDVQAVSVVTPPSLAYPICREAVKAGKPILIEKPLACTGADAREIVRLAESSALALMPAHTLRFDPAVLALKAESAGVGPRRYLMLSLRAEPRADLWTNPADYGGRGVLLEIGVHLLDLVRFLTNEEVAEVRCEMDRAGPEQPESRAVVTLRTIGGLACVLDVSRVGAGRTGRAEWIGEEGQVCADWVEHRVRRLSPLQAVKEWMVPNQPTVAATLASFVDAVAREAPMPITGRDGLKAVEIADACYESAATERWVRVAR